MARAADGRTGRAAALGLAAAVVVVDQVTKVWAERELADRDVSVVGDVLTLTLVRNPGSAFGFGAGGTLLRTVLALAVVAAVLVVLARARSRAWALVLGLVAGGGVGNLVDRFVRDPGPLRGEVVDFLRLPSWPVFNVADMAVTVGALGLALLSLRGVPLRPEEPAGTEDATTTDGSGSRRAGRR